MSSTTSILVAAFVAAPAFVSFCLLFIVWLRTRRSFKQRELQEATMGSMGLSEEVNLNLADYANDIKQKESSAHDTQLEMARDSSYSSIPTSAYNEHTGYNTFFSLIPVSTADITDHHNSYAMSLPSLVERYPPPALSVQSIRSANSSRRNSLDSLTSHSFSRPSLHFSHLHLNSSQPNLVSSNSPLSQSCSQSNLLSHSKLNNNVSTFSTENTDDIETVDEKDEPLHLKPKITETNLQTTNNINLTTKHSIVSDSSATTDSSLRSHSPLDAINPDDSFTDAETHNPSPIIIKTIPSLNTATTNSTITITQTPPPLSIPNRYINNQDIDTNPPNIPNMSKNLHAKKNKPSLPNLKFPPPQQNDLNLNSNSISNSNLNSNSISISISISNPNPILTDLLSPPVIPKPRKSKPHLHQQHQHPKPKSPQLSSSSSISSSSSTLNTTTSLKSISIVNSTNSNPASPNVSSSLRFESSEIQLHKQKQKLINNITNKNSISDTNFLEFDSIPTNNSISNSNSNSNSSNTNRNKKNRNKNKNHRLNNGNGNGNGNDFMLPDMTPNFTKKRYIPAGTITSLASSSSTTNNNNNNRNDNENSNGNGNVNGIPLDITDMGKELGIPGMVH